MAIGAHPDDIEFYMAGTLLLLKERGFDIHYMNLSSGSCGTVSEPPAKIKARRLKEGKSAAQTLGAKFYPPIADDLEIIYDLRLLRKVAAVIRKAAPSILLTHSPVDYMEDHTNTCRLVVTAAFARGMPNFKTSPAIAPIPGDIAIYHAMPHGLKDPLRQPVTPELFVDTTDVHHLKLKSLACHKSQKEWLDVSQGMDSYLQNASESSFQLGKLSKRFKHAEGWRRHLHIGFSFDDGDPLAQALKGKVSYYAKKT